MTAPIVVGVDGTGSGLDAVALAVRLARAPGPPLVVPCVYPGGRRPSGDAAAVRGPAAKALEAAEALAEEAAAEYRTVPSSPPPPGAGGGGGAGGEAAAGGGPSSTRPAATGRSATPPPWRQGRACPSPCSRSSASTSTGSCPRPSGL